MAETLPKISIACVECTNVTDDRQTDGRWHIANRERWAKFLSPYLKLSLDPISDILLAWGPLRELEDATVLPGPVFHDGSHLIFSVTEQYNIRFW